MRYVVAILVLLLCTGNLFAALPWDFSRYEVILQRKPFGEPPPPPPQQAPVVKEGPPKKTFVDELKITLTAITDHPDFGTRVGFEARTDPRSKETKSYYMRPGETRDGIMVLDVDFEKEGVQLQRGVERAWVYIGGGEAGLGSVDGSASSGGGSTAVQRLAAAAGAGGSASIPRTSYAERLKLRKQMMEEHHELKVRQAEKKISADELKKHLQEYQMELIRAGGSLGPPLPIPLTKEMDDQLVSEGVLPPVEQE